MVFGLDCQLCEKGKVKEHFSREKEKIKESRIIDNKGTRQQGAMCIVVEARRWAIRVYSAQNLNMRLDKVIGSKMDKVRGGEAVDGSGSKWVGR